MSEEPDLLKMLAVAENAEVVGVGAVYVGVFTPARARMLVERVVTAEYQVARVRELSWYLEKLSPGDKHYAKLIDRALDGEPV